MTENTHQREDQGVIEAPEAATTPVPIGCVEPLEDRDVDRIARFCDPSRRNHHAADDQEVSPHHDGEIRLNTEDDVDCRTMLRLGGNGF